MVMAPIKSQLLKAGIDLGIFDALVEFSAAEQVAATIGSHAHNTRRFLNALATIGLVQKQKGLFRNRPEAADFLVKSSPTYLGPFLQMVHNMCVEPLNHIVGMIKEGPLFQTGEHDFASEELWAQVTRDSAAWVSGGAGAKMAQLVSRLPEFSSFNRMLDLGGGHGMFTLYFINAHPTMTGVVYDLPPVADISREFIREYDALDRVSVMAGDYTADSIGDSYDLIFAAGTLYFAKDRLNEIISKIHDALNPGGIFISQHNEVWHERTKPGDHIFDFLFYELSGMDLIFTKGTIAEAIMQCGFKSVRNFTIESDLGPLDIDVARK
jgi:SAM-dependent methyltransferase